MNVQYGCGLDAPDGWVNFDASPTLRLQKIPLIGRLITRGRVQFSAAVRYGDIVKGLPVAENSCDCVYCSHVLEHLALEELPVALNNTHRILKRGGIFRIVVPDLEFFANEYLRNPSEDAGITFLSSTLLGEKQRSKGAIAKIIDGLGNNYHRWMWDYKGLSCQLKKVGFVKIRRAYYHDSCSPEFMNVEHTGRWEDALGIECVKE